MISVNSLYWIMLTQALGYNNPKFKKLAEMYSDISLFIEKGEKEWRLSGLFTALDIGKLSAMDRLGAEKILKRCQTLHYSLLTLDDPAYPNCLYHIYAPPAVLYISGNMPDVDNTLSVGIVGTRRASRYGTENSYKIAYALAKYQTIIVSGGALGVDCASHRGALAANGVTVCVRGCGINSRYLKDNEKMRQAITKNGAVISEYPPDEEPRGYYFPARNRIIAALSDGLLVIEAGVKSGSLITADYALEMGKDLFALVGNNSPRNEGSNNRIKEGTALPVTDFTDILATYLPDHLTAEPVSFDSALLADIETIPIKNGAFRAASGLQSAGLTTASLLEAGRQTPKRRQKTEMPENGSSGADALPKRKSISLDGDAQKIYAYLSSTPVHIDTIAGDLGLPVSRVLGTLTMLEMQDCVLALQGRKYKLK